MTGLGVRVEMDLGAKSVQLTLPEETPVLTMSRPRAPLADPEGAIATALANPIGAPPLSELVRSRLSANPAARACVVISDNTRPVPYRGEAGILWPVIEMLIAGGVPARRITVLVATGTHRPVRPPELREMLDPRVFEAGVEVVNHDCWDRAGLARLGTTSRGTELYVNRLYLECDLRILTGLVESHFMAGASGGRKAIVPGLIGEQSTQIFHGARILASPDARDLVLAGNPCHEEALEGARMAGADFIVNVTLDRDFRLTGVYAGDLEAAHELAVEDLRGYVGIPVAEPYDIVVTHTGRVGINHYQAAKAAVAGASAAAEGGFLIVAGHHTDVDPVGSLPYRTMLHLLKLIGPERFDRLLLSPDWTFVHDQWEPQMWSKVLRKIPEDRLYYCATGLGAGDYRILPGVDGNSFLPPGERYSAGPRTVAAMVEAAVADALVRARKAGRARPAIAYLADGPYGIPLTGAAPSRQPAAPVDV